MDSKNNLGTGGDDLQFNIQLERSIPSQPSAIQGQNMGGTQPQNLDNTNVSTNNQQLELPKFLRDSSQPSVCIMHFAFKLAAMICYLLMNFFVRNLILTYIVVLTLVIMDFWTVKNVTGRKLVGLRWWSLIKEDGTEDWMFESEQREINQADHRVFWITNYASPVIWVLLSLLNILTFSISNALICVFSAGLSIVNLMAYRRCETNHNANVKGFIFDQAQKNLTPQQIMGFAMEAGKYTAAMRQPGSHNLASNL